MSEGNKRIAASGKRPRNDRGPQSPFEQLKALLFPKPRRPYVEITEDHIRSILIARRGREAIFGRELFSDPAWDILLELYAANLAGRGITLSELVTGIGSPPSTAGRWIATLEARGLVESSFDPRDATRLRVSLTAEGLSKLKRLADHWASAFVSI